jgi:hypothetical protein
VSKFGCYMDLSVSYPTAMHSAWTLRRSLFLISGLVQTDSVILLSHDILVDPLLSPKVFPDVAENITGRGVGMSICWVTEQVVKRLAQKSCEER